jgi:hypothetical protein
MSVLMGMSSSTGRAGSAMFSVFAVWWENAILFFLKCSGFILKSRLGLLVLLMLMNQIACCHDFEASKENHVDGFLTEFRAVGDSERRI